MGAEFIKIELENSVAIVTITRSQALNALNSQVIDELAVAVNALQQNQEINVIIITGAGKAFVAGADIKEMEAYSPVQAAAYAQKANQVFRQLELMDKPVIAAVNGFALGGGCELALACDIRIASEFAKFGQPEVGLGITPGFGGTQRLSRLVGVGFAKELIYTGNIIDCTEALRIGLVNRVVPAVELLETAKALASKISRNGQLAVGYAKQAINRGTETDLDSALALETNLFSLCFATSDQKEGMQAFIEKRKPTFNNK